jgi:hypothetical protein
MSVEENVELMRRWFKEVWNEGRTQTIHDLLAPDGVGIGEHEDGRPLRGPSEFVPFVERIRGAFPASTLWWRMPSGQRIGSSCAGRLR